MAKWAPVDAAAVGANLIGGAAILYANRHRAKHQYGVTANTVTKLVLTGAALGATVYNGVLGANLRKATDMPCTAPPNRRHPLQQTSPPPNDSCNVCSGRCPS